MENYSNRAQYIMQRNSRTKHDMCENLANGTKLSNAWKLMIKFKKAQYHLSELEKQI